MRFYVKSRGEINGSNYEYPCMVLVGDNWDDYSFRTLFTLYYYAAKNGSQKIGTVRIMDINNEETRGDTILRIEFENLEDNFCSLGTTVEYYKNLAGLDIAQSPMEILNALNDAACLPSVRDKFEDTSGFQTSLLREREAKTALQQGDRIIKGIPVNPKISFTFTTKLQHAHGSHEVNFLFDRRADLQRRIFGIIGKNGTGKTLFVSNLANALSFVRSEFLPRKLKKGTIKLEDHETGSFDTKLGPPFGKVIAISYSLFDNFKRPKPDKHFSHIYCGLRDEKDNINKSLLAKRHIDSLRELNRKRRVEVWVDVIFRFIDDPSSLKYVFDQYGMKITNIESLNANDLLTLSSGHSMLIYTLTELIANVSEDSLILFDEPENHLHPNAIANLINALHYITKKYDAFMIISTHSPIVVQEIPSRSIYVFERDGNVPTTRPLEIESYGENLTTITEHIFETAEVPDGYKEYLTSLADTRSYDEVIAMFENELSLNAKIFLAGLYSRNS